jgi:hypothetical protein
VEPKFRIRWKRICDTDRDARSPRRPSHNGIGSETFVRRDGAITFRDIVGKLDMIRITCDKCDL